ncbi:MAG TPA: hypothetical protein VNU92_06350 [Edaphobacter sp.]|jgi:hypothetical protein|nr:hypothetical protein [Edaphobacter sp.]
MNNATSSFSSCVSERTILFQALLAALLSVTFAANAQASGDLQQKVAALKQSAADNQQKLHQYQWIETSQLTLNGDTKPATQSLCQYGPDGKVQKTPIGPPQQPQAPSGGRLKQKVVAKKKEEMKDYMGQVKTLLAMYVPPDPQRIQQAFQSGKASLNATAGTGTAGIVLKDYAQPGDQMTVSFNTAEKKISALNVNSYLDDPKDTVTLAVKFASLPDSTNYVQQSILNATAKKLHVTTTSSDYHPLAAH